MPVYLAGHLEMKLLCAIPFLTTGLLFTSFSLLAYTTLEPLRKPGKVG